MTWSYEKMDSETGNIIKCPINDDDGSITGSVRINLAAWYDENPDVRISHGWTKHIHYSQKDDPDIYPTYNRQTEYLVYGTEQVDEYTIKDVYRVLEKSEEQLLLEELLQGIDTGFGIHFIMGA